MISILLSFVFATSAFAYDTIPAGCTASPNFSADAYRVWIEEGTKKVANQEALLGPMIAVGQRSEIQLIPQGVEAHGFVNFEIPDAGTYVIATDAYPRMDLTDASSGYRLNPVSFGKIRDCGTVSKVLRFEFTQPHKIQLGLVSSQSPVLNILIWRLN